jgi:hypothetical protein
MEAYPLLVRKRIIQLYEQNKSTKEIAELFGICRSGTRPREAASARARHDHAAASQCRTQAQTHAGT